MEDCQLGIDDIQSSSPKDKTSSSLPSTVANSSSDPRQLILQLILIHLEAMQGLLAVLEMKNSNNCTSSNEVFMAESVGHTEESGKEKSASVFATIEEDDHGVLNEEGDCQTHHK